MVRILDENDYRWRLDQAVSGGENRSVSPRYSDGRQFCATSLRRLTGVRSGSVERREYSAFGGRGSRVYDVQTACSLVAPHRQAHIGPRVSNHVEKIAAEYDRLADEEPGDGPPHGGAGSEGPTET